ncbi:Ig-like domain-containing protein [Candidatus Micrarchaeota archaeon]|nr:Ig-like domain-containing protein [Candidatus Micrarchaeota archaeon]
MKQPAFFSCSPLFFLFLLCALPTAFFVDPPHAQVKNNNDALASRLNHYNASSFSLPWNCVPSYDCPVYFFESKLFTAYPSVNNFLPPSNNVSFLWGWGEDHGGSYEKPIPNDPRCGGYGVASRGPNGEPTAEFFKANLTLKIFNNETNSTQQLNKQLDLCRYSSCSSIQTPFQLNFSNEELSKAMPASNSTDFNLNVKLKGKVVFPYIETRTITSYRECPDDCSEGCECGCLTDMTTSYPDMIIEAESELKYIVAKPASVSSFVSNPFSRDAALNTVTFSQNSIYKAYALLDEKIVSAVYFFEFDKKRHANYGFEWIEKIEAQSKGVKASDAEAITTGFSNASGLLALKLVNCSDYSTRLSNCVSANSSNCSSLEQSVASCNVLPQRFHIAFTVSNALLGTREMKVSQRDVFSESKEAVFNNSFLSKTFLSLQAQKLSEEKVKATAFLKNEYSLPIPSAQISFSTREINSSCVTDLLGSCAVELFSNANETISIQASFAGSNELEPAKASHQLLIPPKRENVFGVLTFLIAIVIGLGGGFHFRFFK